jgi:hypothetical protein
MKTISRRSQQQTRRPPPSPSTREPEAQPAAAALVGTSGLGTRAHVINAVWTKHGPRKNWSKRQLAQFAIHALHPHGLAENANQTQLTKEVNAWLLANHPHFATRYVEINRVTVLRAAGLLKR